MTSLHSNACSSPALSGDLGLSDLRGIAAIMEGSKLGIIGNVVDDDEVVGTVVVTTDSEAASSDGSLSEDIAGKATATEDV